MHFGFVSSVLAPRLTTMLALVLAELGIVFLTANAGRALPANVVFKSWELGDYRAATFQLKGMRQPASRTRSPSFKTAKCSA